MAHGVFRTVLAIMFSLPLVAIAYSEAPAQERATCSQARWTVGLVKRCGYEKRPTAIAQQSRFMEYTRPRPASQTVSGCFIDANGRFQTFLD
jgi:hypothetical protein